MLPEQAQGWSLRQSSSTGRAAWQAMEEAFGTPPKWPRSGCLLIWITPASPVGVWILCYGYSTCLSSTSWVSTTAMDYISVQVSAPPGVFCLPTENCSSLDISTERNLDIYLSQDLQ